MFKVSISRGSNSNPKTTLTRREKVWIWETCIQISEMFWVLEKQETGTIEVLRVTWSRDGEYPSIQFTLIMKLYNDVKCEISGYSSIMSSQQVVQELVEAFDSKLISEAKRLQKLQGKIRELSFLSCPDCGTVKIPKGTAKCPNCK